MKNWRYSNSCWTTRYHCMPSGLVASEQGRRAREVGRFVYQYTNG